jgi:hypothetical protein
MGRSVRISSSGCNLSFLQSNINLLFLQIKKYGVTENKHPRQWTVRAVSLWLTVLSNAGHWDGYEELHIERLVALSHVSLPLRAWLNNSFLGRWIGSDEKTEWSSLVPSGVIGPKKKSDDQNKEHLIQMEQENRKIFVSLPLEFLRKNVYSLTFRLQKCMQNDTCIEILLWYMGFEITQEF